ncbi:MAG: hypothetical protein JRN50_02255 [Nitrososphaerota archaeon]|nr:hypothetical protein [Nitrososphaerota archaeon]
MSRERGHLYTHGGRRRNLPEFEKRYGREHGKEVYGAVVGKVRRERMAEGKCSMHGCGAPAIHSHGGHGCCGHPFHCSEISMAHFSGRVRDRGSRDIWRW